jgi:hypothetical protein
MKYAMRHDGTYYGAHLEKVFQQRREAALSAAMSGYWLVEFSRAPAFFLKFNPPCLWQLNLLTFLRVLERCRGLAGSLATCPTQRPSSGFRCDA